MLHVLNHNDSDEVPGAFDLMVIERAAFGSVGSLVRHSCPEGVRYLPPRDFACEFCRTYRHCIATLPARMKAIHKDCLSCSQSESCDAAKAVLKREAKFTVKEYKAANNGAYPLRALLSAHGNLARHVSDVNTMRRDGLQKYREMCRTDPHLLVAVGDFSPLFPMYKCEKTQSELREGMIGCFIVAFIYWADGEEHITYVEVVDEQKRDNLQVVMWTLSTALKSDEFSRFKRASR